MPVSRNSRNHRKTGNLYTTTYAPYELIKVKNEKGEIETVKKPVRNPNVKRDVNQHIVLNTKVYHPRNLHPTHILTQKEINNMQIHKSK